MSSFNILPFIIFITVFRVISSRFRGTITAYWYVTGKRDIADFYVSVRDKNNGQIIWEKSLDYTKRLIRLSVSELEKNVADMQLCVIAKKSTSELSSWIASQCRNLSDNFDELAGKRKNFFSSIFAATTSGADLRFRPSLVLPSLYLLTNIILL